MVLVLALSTIMGVCRTQWIIVWIFLEINTLAICYILRKDSNSTNKPHKTAFLYFAIQALSSAVIFLCSTQERVLITPLLMFALIIKIGAWPIHLWYVKIITDITIEQKTTATVMTWQKILPVILLSYTPLIVINQMLLIVVILTIVAPITHITEQSSVKRVLILSSTRTNRWLITASILSTNLLVIFWVFYTHSLLLLLKTVKKNNKKRQKHPRRVLTNNPNDL